MKKQCSNCNYWVLDHLWEISYYDDSERGQCTKALMSTHKLITDSTPMVVSDASGYFAALFTSPDHCCNSWERKEETR